MKFEVPDPGLIPLIVLVSLLFASGCRPSLAPKSFPAPSGDGTAPDSLQPRPDDALSPADVVRIQVEALRANDATNSGVATAYAFASPINKLLTGPLERFREMLRSRDYACLFRFTSVEYGEVEIKDGRALQIVLFESADGRVEMLLFELSKQSGETCRNCWMTDGVFPAQIDLQPWPSVAERGE